MAASTKNEADPFQIGEPGGIVGGDGRGGHGRRGHRPRPLRLGLGTRPAAWWHSANLPMGRWQIGAHCAGGILGAPGTAWPSASACHNPIVQQAVA